MRNKLLLIFVLGIFLFSGVSAWSNSTFNNSLSTENITFTGDENYTRWLSVPENTYVTNGQINLSGYDNPEIQTVTTLFSWNQTGNNLGLEGNGTYFWNIDRANDSIEQYNLTGTLINEFDVSAKVADYPTDIYSNGTNLFISSGANAVISVYTYSGVWTEDITVTGTSLSSGIFGIGGDGTNFWVGGFLPDIIFKMNSDLSTQISNKTVSHGVIYGISVDDNYIWWCDYQSSCGRINKDFTDERGFSAGGIGIYSNNTNIFISHNTEDSLKTALINKYPINISLFLNDTSILSHAGEFNSTFSPNKTSNFANTINNYISKATAVAGNYLIPFIFHSDTVGILEYLILKFSNDGFIENSQTYTSPIVSGSNSTFAINTSYDSTEFSNAIGNLVYNGTSYLGTKSGSGNDYIFTKNLKVPVVTTQTNVSFYWSIILNNGTDNYYNSTSYNQTINIMGVDNCSTYTNVLYNFTIVDEKTQVKLNPTTQNTTGKVNLIMYSTLDGSQISNYSQLYSKNNSYSVCLSSNLSAGESYKVDLENQYTADNYATEFYNIQKSTITSASMNQNITLYNLDNSTAQVFTVTYRDASFLPVEGALVTVTRKYIDEGVFKTVEAPVTDANGQTLVNLELYNAIYTFVFSKDGVVLSTFDNSQVKCSNLVLAQCDLTFNAVTASISPVKYIDVDGMSYVLSYDNTTRVVSNTFTITDGTLKTVSINATLMNSLNSAVCSNQLTSSSGTVSCTIPANFNNGSALIKTYQDGVWAGQGSVFLGQNNKSLYGSNLLFLSIFMFLTLFGIGLSDNPMVTGIFLFIGAIIGLGMNLTANTGVVGAGATALWLLIAIILVIVKGARRA